MQDGCLRLLENISNQWKIRLLNGMQHAKDFNLLEVYNLQFCCCVLENHKYLCQKIPQSGQFWTCSMQLQTAWKSSQGLGASNSLANQIQKRRIANLLMEMEEEGSVDVLSEIR